VDNAAEREAYRAALLEMCKAVPPEQDPCAGWSADLWAVLINVSEPFRGVLLLRQVFERAPGEIRSLRTADRQYLEEILAGGLRILEPAAVPRWLDRFEQDESEATARFRWKLERFDYTLYDLNDAASARPQAAELASAAKTPEEKALAQIRAGDVERAAGNLPAAKAAYSAAQDWYRDRIRAISSGQGAIPPPSRSTRRERPRRRQTEPSPAPSPTPPQNWKTFALHEASFLVTVRHLIAGGFLFEARDALGRWELEYPLCKVSGDYPLAEAEYHMAAQHYRRALAGLRIYRAGVEISSSLPEAMQLELECLSRLKEKDEAQKLAREILRQFPNHPVANKAREVLAGGV
jgi:TolA-binding protein